MKRTALFLIILISVTITGLAQNSLSEFILEINETHTPAFRDQEGQVHLYYTIHGLSSSKAIDDFNNYLQSFDQVIENENLTITGASTSFHTTFYSEADISFLKKLFYKHGVYRTIFFGEWYNTNDLTHEITSKHITL